MGSPLAFLAGLAGLFTDRPKWWALAAVLVSGPFVAMMVKELIGPLCR